MRWDCAVVETVHRWVKQVYKLRKEEKKKRKLYCLFDNINTKTNGSSFSYYFDKIMKDDRSLILKIFDWFKK